MSERTIFWAVFSASILTSLGWFAVCVDRGWIMDAGRGGNIGLAIALTLGFINHDYGARLFTMWSQTWPDLLARIDALKNNTAVSRQPATVQQLEERIEQLAKVMSIEAEGRRTETLFVALATFVGTAMAGFGDWLAALLQ